MWWVATGARGLLSGWRCFGTEHASSRGDGGHAWSWPCTKSCTSAVGLIVWGMGRSKAGNGITLGAGGQSAAHAATDGLRKAVSGQLHLCFRKACHLLPGGGVERGPEGDLSSLRIKLLLSSEKVLDALCPALLATFLPEASASTQGCHKGKYIRLPW